MTAPPFVYDLRVLLLVGRIYRVNIALVLSGLSLSVVDSEDTADCDILAFFDERVTFNPLLVVVPENTVSLEIEGLVLVVNTVCRHEECTVAILSAELAVIGNLGNKAVYVYIG